jgi:hypothetical protein
MHPDDILAALRRRPFAPFRLRVSDGSACEMRHWDVALVSRRAVVIGLPVEPTQPADLLVTVAVVHVTRLEEPPAPAAQTGNGTG